jgi:hypothetical protein
VIVESTASGTDVFAVRSKLGMTQRVFGARSAAHDKKCRTARSGKASPKRTQFQKLMKLAAAIADTRSPLSAVEP